MTTIVVTGGTGYIGERLVAQGKLRGYDLTVASRKQPKTCGVNWIPFDIADGGNLKLPGELSAIIHLAANTSCVNVQEADREVSVANKLTIAAREQSVKFIFVSSQTARPDAPTLYGQTKWRIEQIVLSTGGWVVRPGLVYGGVPGGLFGELLAIVRRLPILPMLFPAPMVQPIHVDDLATGLLTIACRDDLSPGVLCIASSLPITFTSFLRAVARDRLRVRKLFFPVFVMPLSKLCRLLGSNNRLQTAMIRLKSLNDLPLMDTVADLKILGLNIRPLSSGMHPSGDARRRRLMVEAYALLRYVLRAHPESAAMRRYVHAIEKLRGGKALLLPGCVQRYPGLLSAIDKINHEGWDLGTEFQWRLNAASLIAEATPRGGRRFLGSDRCQSPIRSLLRIILAIASELGWRTTMLIFAPMMRVVLQRSANKEW